MEDKAKLWMYENTYKTRDNHPEKTGTGEIPVAVMRAFVAKAKETNQDTINLRCASWERVSKAGKPYTFITMELDEKEKPEQQRKPDPTPSSELPW